MNTAQEGMFREAFFGMVEARFGDQNLAALQCDWELFRTEGLPALALPVGELSDQEAAQVILAEVTEWCLGRGYGSSVF
jgi:hypothetical protein